MAKTIIECPECSAKSTITSTTDEPVQCCPFCANTVLPEGDVEDEFDDDYERSDEE
jgi:hypothetical protein